VTDDAGAPVRMLGTAQDITERRRADNERAQLAREQHARREAEEANRLKDHFLAMVSHELRTPLNAVVGWAHMMAQGLVEKDRMPKAVEAIERNSLLQQRLIDDLLDVSAATTGRVRLEVHRVELGSIVSAAVDSVGVAARARFITIGTRFDTPVIVKGDAQRLQQIVWNLLSNAVKYTPEGGRIDVSLTRSTAHATLRVADGGNGIEASLLPHVFDPFWQGDPKGRRGGLGLGLAIVRALVEAHGGTVHAASAGIGQGATFTVRLPLGG
jgi:signal transduction histidine kinase